MSSRLFAFVRLAAAGVLVIALGSALDAAPSGALRIGDVLPPLRGSMLTGKDVTLPEGSAGKTALLILGFTYESRHAVEPWAGWFKKAMRGREDVTFFEMPMIGGIGKLGRWFIDRGMRKSTAVELHEHVITVYSGAGDWKRRLGVTDANKDDAFLILVDGQGVVRSLHRGPYDAATARTIEAAIAAAAGSSLR